MSSVSTRIPTEKVEYEADRVLKKNGVLRIPVDPLIVARSEGIEVENAVFQEPNISGFITKNGLDINIFVKHDDIPSRKKFTIAHELGHFFLHLKDREAGDFVELYRGAQDQDQDKEIEANAFAAALLMPRDHVRKVWREVDSVEEMALRFGVSVSAMGYRLGNLGLLI